jgi:gag-polypeptide of LTR copia-type/Zinc knuckle
MASEESATSGSFKLQPLTSTNYFKWAVEVECVLDMRDLWSAVLEDEEFLALKDDATRKRQSRKARSFLLFHVSPKLRESVIGAATAKELWDSLKDRFNKKSSDRTATLHQQLTSAAQRTGEKMPEYLSRLEGLVRELKESCNETVSDGMLVGILMNGVLPVHNETITALRCLDALKLDSLKQKLIAAEERMSDSQRRESNKDKAQVFVAGGLAGNPADKRPDKRSDKKSERRSVCYYCAESGHIAPSCPVRKAAAAAKQAARAAERKPARQEAVALMTHTNEYTCFSESAHSSSFMLAVHSS